MIRVWNTDRLTLAGEKTEVEYKDLSKCRFSAINPTCIGVEPKSNIRGGRPATAHVSHGTVLLNR